MKLELVFGMKFCFFLGYSSNFQRIQGGIQGGIDAINIAGQSTLGVPNLRSQLMDIYLPSWSVANFLLQLLI